MHSAIYEKTVFHHHCFEDSEVIIVDRKKGIKNGKIIEVKEGEYDHDSLEIRVPMKELKAFFRRFLEHNLICKMGNMKDDDFIKWFFNEK